MDTNDSVYKIILQASHKKVPICVVFDNFRNFLALIVPSEVTDEVHGSDGCDGVVTLEIFVGRRYIAVPCLLLGNDDAFGIGKVADTCVFQTVELVFIHSIRLYWRRNVGAKRRIRKHL